MRSMGSPDYLYKPQSKRSRTKRGDAYRARHGIPDGFRRVYGVDVPEKLAAALRHIVVRRIKPDTLKYANPLRCVPRDLAQEFCEEALYRLASAQDVSDKTMLLVAKRIVQAHGRPWSIKRRAPPGKKMSKPKKPPAAPPPEEPPEDGSDLILSIGQMDGRVVLNFQNPVNFLYSLPPAKARELAAMIWATANKLDPPP